mmetsp:Transcript_51368/g.122053  ORF Transcript_51368/g.122053 Transcript_51368/m.122053 type:complete len:325 (+) Transcript_51368:79-1053(+)
MALKRPAAAASVSSLRKKPAASSTKKSTSAAVRQRPAQASVPLRKPASALKTRPAARSEVLAEEEQEEDESEPEMSPEFQKLLDTHSLDALYNQLHFGDVAGRRNWHYSLQEGPEYGKLRIGTDSSNPMAFDFQILGTESHLSGTWLWSWANDYGGMPPDLTTSAGKLRAGDLIAEPPPEFTTGHFKLEQAHGHQLASVAAALLNCPAYYCAPNPGGTGASFLLITDPDFPARKANSPPDEAMRLVRVVNQALQLGWVSNWRHAIDSFLNKRAQHRKGEGEGEGAAKKVTYFISPADGSLEVAFNDEDKVASVAYIGPGGADES